MSNVVQINFDLIVLSGHVMLCLLAGYVVVITSIIYIEYHIIEIHALYAPRLSKVFLVSDCGQFISVLISNKPKQFGGNINSKVQTKI